MNKDLSIQETIINGKKLPTELCGLTINHNPNRVLYQSVKEYIEQLEELGASHIDEWKDEKSKQIALETNQLWEIHWYPNTPVGHCIVFAPTLEEALELACE